MLACESEREMDPGQATTILALSLFLFMCACVSVCACHICADAQEGQKGELQAVVSHQMCVLGTELWSSARAASTLDH